MPIIGGGGSGGVVSATWVNYDCAPTGFSGTPTQTTSRYIVLGKLCTIFLDVTGTSNATTFTLAAPFAAARAHPGMLANLVNAGTNVAGFVQLVTASSTITCFTTVGGGAWTASGTKGGVVYLAYETA